MELAKRLDDFIEKWVSRSLVVSIFLILLLSVLVIVLRWFSISFTWYDPFVRHLVFITAFLGGTIATGRGSNIAIDIVGRFFESKENERIQKNIERFVLVISSLTLIFLIKASIEFSVVEFEYGAKVFWGIHSGFLVSIIPAGFGMICIRFVLKFIKTFEAC